MSDFYGEEYSLEGKDHNTKIRLKRKDADILREVIAEYFQYSLPRYFEKVGIKPSNGYAVLSGDRPCTVEFLNKMLSGVGFQVTIETKLVLHRIDVGEDAPGVDLQEPEGEWPFINEEGPA